ncbi:hypothetical protein bwei_1667 [Bacillus mycoides]|nr:hypothetical protein bwei_1667 [Bacillus mycoides]
MIDNDDVISIIKLRYTGRLKWLDVMEHHNIGKGTARR